MPAHAAGEVEASVELDERGLGSRDRGRREVEPLAREVDPDDLDGAEHRVADEAGEGHVQLRRRCTVAWWVRTMPMSAPPATL